MGTVDDQLAALDPADRASVERIYAIGREIVPDAEQGKGYGMPAILHRGKPLVSVMRAHKHIGVYPFSPEAVAAVADMLEGHPGVGLAKGTIRYQPSDPLPDDVVRALITARREQIDR